MDLRTTKALLKKHHIRPNRLRGQNFLVNDRIAGHIVGAARIQPGETVLEIGPGLGALTTKLLELARHVIAVEIDPLLCDILREELGEQQHLELINEDFLNVDLAAMVERTGGGGLKVVSNLPYQITGQAVRRILDHMRLLRGAVITVQREVAERMLSGPGSKNYGILSVATQYYSIPRMALRIPREAFSPRPQVISTALFLGPRSAPPVEVRDETLFFASVGALFGHRRKTAGNALRNHPRLQLGAERLKDLSRRTAIDLSRRGETMSLSELAEISNALWEQEHACQGI